MISKCTQMKDVRTSSIVGTRKRAMAFLRLLSENHKRQEMRFLPSFLSLSSYYNILSAERASEQSDRPSVHLSDRFHG